MDRKRTAQIILVNGVILLGMMVGGELYLRKAYPFLATKFLGEIMPHELYNHTLRPGHAERFTFKGYPVDRKFNSLGLAHREEVQVPKPASLWRVLFVGDSFVQGMEGESAVPAVVQSMVNKVPTGQRIEIINCGQSTYSPLLHIVRFKHQLCSLGADAVVYLPDLTDVYDDWVRYKALAVYDDQHKLLKVSASGYGTYFHDKLARWGYYRVNCFLYKAFLLKSVLRSVNVKRSEESEEGIFDHCLDPEDHLSPLHQEMVDFSVQNIKAYMDLVRGAGIHVSVVVYPHEPQIAGKYNRAYEGRIRELCQSEGIPFHSFFEEIKSDSQVEEQLYLSGDMHFTPTGYRKLGEHIGEWIYSSPEEAIGVAPQDKDLPADSESERAHE